ncbi:hypothetical protein [Vibrio cholerae]|uniref:hypothetical protein n=1 Tax=Vibrio cholerae TaxID=666 RepID=UPI00307FE55D
MQKLFRLLNPYVGNRAYVIGPLMIIWGTQFASEKITAIAFLVSGLVLMVTRPLTELGEKQKNSEK